MRDPVLFRSVVQTVLFINFLVKVKEIVSSMDIATGKELVYRWSVTQTQTIEEQLQSGIRYLDLRISYNHSQREM